MTDILKLHAKGFSEYAISRRLGLSRGFVCRRIAEAGKALNGPKNRNANYRSKPAPDPSEAEIKQAAAAIRATWSPAETRHRAGLRGIPPVELQEVSVYCEGEVYR